MEIVAQIKEYIIAIQNTKNKNNIKLANELEKCLLTCYTSKTNSTKVKKENISLSFNQKSVRTRVDGQNQWTELKENNN